MEYLLQTEGLTKQYRRCMALDHVFLKIPRGAVYGLLGEQGAGKTTLLRLVCGLQKVTEGGYALYGVPHDRQELEAVRRRMGALVGAPAIYLDLTAEENIRQELLVRNCYSAERLGELLELAGCCGDARERKARELLPDLRQRLGLILALAGNPEFLVLDEPAEGTSAQGRLQQLRLIKRLNLERGLTVLLAASRAEELAGLATRVGILHRGRLVEELGGDALGNGESWPVRPFPRQDPGRGELAYG